MTQVMMAGIVHVDAMSEFDHDGFVVPPRGGEDRNRPLNNFFD